jgi:hypothetical protein
MIRIVKLQLFKKNRYELNTQEENEKSQIKISDRQFLIDFAKVVDFI